MVVKVGKYGGIGVFYNDILMSSIPCHKENYADQLIKEANEVLVAHMEKGTNITEIIKICEAGVKVYYKRKHIEKKRLLKVDHEYFCSCVLVLIRAGILERDDVLLEMPNKRLLKKNNVCS